MQNPLQQWKNLLQQFSHLPKPEITQSAKTVVYQQDKIKLYHYTPLKKNTHAIPLLITFALVNRPYILDLQPDRSLIQALLQVGIDVYLLDWGYPTAEDKELRLEDYILTYLHHSINFIKQRSQQEKINLLGVCQGGTFSLCYSALYPENINKLTTMVTPIDFHTDDNQLTALVKNLDVAALAKQYGNIPGWLLNQMFFSLKSPATHWLKYQKALSTMHDAEKTAHFLRMEQWIFDTPDLAANAFVQYVTQLYQQNALIKGQFYLQNKKVDLKKITMPVFNIYAQQDDIVPASASKCLEQYLSSTQYTSLAFDGGHIGIYASKRAQLEVAPKIVDWLLK